MAPLRVAFIGLSRSSGSSWGSSAHLPYLLAHPTKYSITALLNSSVESAKKAIQDYDLPPSTKAYGSPEELAKDSDIDVVVCSVRVDKHGQALMPILRSPSFKGKAVYSEWPLGRDLAEAREMLDAAEANGMKHVVALQARASPVVRKVKEVIESGKLGKVLSSVWTGAAFNGGGREMESMRYTQDRSVGGNVMTIHGGHTLDSVLFALGAEFDPYNVILGNQRPETQIINKATGEVVDTVIKDTHDTIFIHGRLLNGVLLSYNLRGNKPFPGAEGPGLLWRVNGEKGEIQVTASGVMLNVGGYDDITIKVFDFASEKVETIPWEDEFKKLPAPARNIGRQYESIYSGGDLGIVDWKQAVERHAHIEEMYARQAGDKEGQGEKAQYTSVV
ncbi:hypothetical protein LTS18_004950 [Coniosporium uncinatum]|uniref:Uncharacterized protein n=1 Tax=Coniosporium uncinatum TaxID=93489 RepID=A0ACC3D550_9PEZI|nr:hypothetical protein LTS18_004950 [Coniosporium uncinatum]